RRCSSIPCGARLLKSRRNLRSRNRPVALNVPSPADNSRAEGNVMVLRRRRKGNGREVQARLSAVRADLDSLQQHMRGLVSEVSGAAGQQVQGAMSGAIGAAVTTAHDAAGRIGDWGNENLGGVREAVRSQPLAACVLSIGAGAILGALLVR